MIFLLEGIELDNKRIKGSENMIDKYLPIGTVCTLKGNNKKVMVIGFFSVEYNGNIKMYDYQGCSYPEGILLKNM